MKGIYISFKTNNKAIDKRFYNVLHKKERKLLGKIVMLPNKNLMN